MRPWRSVAGIFSDPSSKVVAPVVTDDQGVDVGYPDLSPFDPEETFPQAEESDAGDINQAAQSDESLHPKTPGSRGRVLPGHDLTGALGGGEYEDVE